MEAWGNLLVGEHTHVLRIVTCPWGKGTETALDTLPNLAIGISSLVSTNLYPL